MANPNAFALYTVVFLRHEDALLLLERSPAKSFAPNRWTGVGGRVEAVEFGDLRASALREVREETGLDPQGIAAFTLRRVLYHHRPGGPLTGLLYFTGELPGRPPLTSSEGKLQWLTPATFRELDIIESTAAVLPFLLEDLHRDPRGEEGVRTGVAHYHPDGLLEAVRWEEVEHPHPRPQNDRT